MPESSDELIFGEHRRALDERFRLSIPGEMVEALSLRGSELVLAKERPGSLSLWAEADWTSRIETSVAVVRQKLEAGRLTDRLEQVQMLGRLLSTRHRPVQLAGRGRLLIPEGFREFLGVDGGGEVMIVGAAVCIEIWAVDAWVQHLGESMSQFTTLLDDLSK